MKLQLFALAFGFVTTLVTASTNSSASVISQLLSNPASVGISSLSGAEVAQLQALNNKGGEWNNCELACSILSILIPSNVSLSSSPSYVPIPYWSVQQASLTPTCRTDVSSAQEISTTLQIAKLTFCPFTVKSGGHAAFAGGSSIQDGILVNLAKMNEVTLSADRKTTRVGPGNVWSGVYEVLDPLGVSVVGGREAGVGVGGLTLGGGISYFSGRYGWACDNVVNYEVVLANGSIVNISPTSLPDLYWALRGGGGSNFGIVSAFDLMTFEQGPLWGGSKLYDMSQNASLADAFSNFVTNAPNDNFAHLYLAFAYTVIPGFINGFFATTGPTYGKPIANASIFAEVDKIQPIPVIGDQTSITNMTELSIALNQTAFSRETFKTVTFKNDAQLIKDVIQLFIDEATPLLNLTGFAPAFAFQPLSLNIIEQMSKNGGNALGLSVDEGPLTIMNLNWGWALASDDSAVYAAVDRFVSRSVSLAKQRGLDNRFIYINYASQEEEVFAGYGTNNERRLERVRREYDPENVFGTLWKGYFKVS
ncbi:FAD-binding domain-containing protein [Stipitochalara longipes BDJ]|nr:FAD-binding domain-containing protein [Stipitochalara longipes BDJ]